MTHKLAITIFIGQSIDSITTKRWTLDRIDMKKEIRNRMLLKEVIGDKWITRIKQGQINVMCVFIIPY